MQKGKDFSIFTHWISELGNSRAKSYKLYNLITIIYSILNLLFALNIQSLLTNSLPAKFSSILFCTATLLVILLLFFPVNKNYKTHRIISDVLFITILAALVSLFYSFTLSPNIPSFLLVSLVFVILISSLHVISFALLKIKYGEIPKDFVELKKKENSLLLKNAFFLEWLFFASLVCFQLIMLTQVL